MSEKIPYEQVMERMKSDIGYIAIEAYQSGYKDCETKYCSFDACRNRQAEYQRGLDDAWNAARKIVAGRFSGKLDTGCVLNYTASEAIEKIKAYEEQQKADEIKVGDIITDGKINYLVIDITDKSYIALQGTDFEPVYIGKDYIKMYHNLHDSKDMTKVAEEISKALKGKQRGCYTCKHQVASSIECVDCRGYDKWQPKEGAE